MEPRCPFCNTTGIESIKGQRLSNAALLIYCGGCGAIHGVVPLPAPEKKPKPTAPATGQANPQPETKAKKGLVKQASLDPLPRKDVDPNRIAQQIGYDFKFRNWDEEP